MRVRVCAITASLVAVGMIAIGCRTKTGGSEIADRKTLERFATLPNVVPVHGTPPSEELISLGRMLYFEPRLSRSQTVSCNSCHPLAHYGADGQPTSTGYKGQHGNRNSPSVYNAAGHSIQFWDGRAPDVEAQAKGPLLNPVEMAMPSAKAVVQVLKSMPEYVAAFHRAFPKDRTPLTFDHTTAAIGAFERKLLTPSRWDRFLRGDETALTADEKGGFNVFVDAGCSSCHGGVFVGGNMLQRLGATKPYPDNSDSGRYNVTKDDGDRMFFKVASLRNVAMTGPYFHNGKVTTLQEAVSQMAEYQLGKQLSDGQVGAIVKWLDALTGELPADYIKEPVLPKSTTRTPKPVTAG